MKIMFTLSVKDGGQGWMKVALLSLASDKGKQLLAKPWNMLLLKSGGDQNFLGKLYYGCSPQRIAT